MPRYEKPAPLDVAGVIALMKTMLTPESFDRWRSEFPDTRIQQFIDEYADYDKAQGWEDEIRDDPDQKGYVMTDEYWEKNFAEDPGWASLIKHGYSDRDAIVGYPEDHAPSDWDLEREQLAEKYKNYSGSVDSSLNSSSIQNAHIEQTPQGTWVVRGDSDRFGKNAILYEHYSKAGARKYLHKLNKTGKNMAISNRTKSNLDSATGSAALPSEFEYQVLDYNQMRTIPKFKDAAEELNRLCHEAHANFPDVYVSGMPDAKEAGKHIIFQNETGMFRWDEAKKKFVPLNSSKGNMRITVSTNCSRRRNPISCLNCAVSEITVPNDFAATQSQAFDLVNIVQNELWDKGMDVTIKQLYRPKPDMYRFSYVITDPTTTDEQVDLAIEEIVAKLVKTGFRPAYGVDLDSEADSEQVTSITINTFDRFPKKSLWDCMNWLEHEMWAEGWDASIESADLPKPDQIAFEVAHPDSISAEDIDDFIKDRVLEFIENDYQAFQYPSNDSRSRYNSSLSCSVDWVSGDGNAFYLVDDGEDEDDGWEDVYEDYKVEQDEYGNDVVHYQGYTVTGNERVGYVALTPYGTWSPQIYRTITDAIDDVDRDIKVRNQKQR